MDFKKENKKKDSYLLFIICCMPTKQRLSTFHRFLCMDNMRPVHWHYGGKDYRDMPIKGAPPNKGAPYGFRTHYTLHGDQNRLNFLNN